MLYEVITRRRDRDVFHDMDDLLLYQHLFVALAHLGRDLSGKNLLVPFPETGKRIAADVGIRGVVEIDVPPVLVLDESDAGEIAHERGKIV